MGIQNADEVDEYLLPNTQLKLMKKVRHKEIIEVDTMIK